MENSWKMARLAAVQEAKKLLSDTAVWKANRSSLKNPSFFWRAKGISGLNSVYCYKFIQHRAGSVYPYHKKR
jgi:hypothetical protein